MNGFKKRPRARIPLLCYAAAAVIWLCLCTGALLLDEIARLQDRMPEVQAEIAAFELCDLEQTETDVLQAVSTDPQLLWYNTDERTVRTLLMRVEFSRVPGEIALYYTEQPDEPFSRDKKIFPIRQADDGYLFVLPRAKVYALRIDPGSEALVMRGMELWFNTGYSWWRYYLPGWQQVFDLILFPGLAACALNILLQMRRQFKASRTA